MMTNAAESPLVNPKTAIQTSAFDGRSIYVVSDLHSGDGSARDNFHHSGNLERLMACLEWIQKEDPMAVIVVLGDFFEFWQSPLGAVITQNLALMDRLSEMKAVYILGNHDNDLEGMIGSTVSLSHPFFERMGTGTFLQRGGKNIALLHGHETDPFNSSPVPGKGRALAIVAGIFEDVNGSPFDKSGGTVEGGLEALGELALELFVKLKATMLGVAFPEGMGTGASHTPSKSVDLTQKNIQAFDMRRKNKEFDILVCGHTHLPGIAKEGDATWYYNSGSWVTKLATFLRIDPSGEIRIFEWKDGGVEPYVATIEY